jgi:hypothetical protein
MMTAPRLVRGYPLFYLRTANLSFAEDDRGLSRFSSAEGADNLLRDRGVDAVAQTLLERRFHAAVLAGVEREDGNPSPVSQAGRQGEVRP